MLIKDPKDRITVDEALKHPFFILHRVQPSTSIAKSGKFVSQVDQPELLKLQSVDNNASYG